MASAVEQPTAMNVDSSKQANEATTTTAPLVGMIYPPPDIRKTVDRAAQFLANKGPQLEERIRENERHNPRFCFMNPTDPYHAYYQYKLREARSASGVMTNGAIQPDTVDQLQQPQEERQQPVVEVAPPEPDSFEFSVPMPAMSAQDLDIIKLTARFAARNGRHFISQLAQRESRNFQFDFLRPTHSLFPYFTELIKQYSKVLVPPEDIKKKLSKNNSRTLLLDRIKQRVEWTIWDEREKKKRAEEDEKEKLAYASIDWHDFVVAETVEFTAEDEKMNLPAPMSLQELESMSLAQRRMASLSAMDEQEIPDFGAYEKALNKELGGEPIEQPTEEKELEPEEQQEPQPDIQQPIVPPNLAAPIKIRTDYKPKLGPQTKSVQETQICPRCGESIPITEMDEHMRIELLDPKWKEQKLAQEAKLRDSNLLQEGTDVAKILKNFSGYRSDIFGSEETEIGKKIAEEESARERLLQESWNRGQNESDKNGFIFDSTSTDMATGTNLPSTTSASAFTSQLPNTYNESQLSNTSTATITSTPTMDATTAAIRKVEDDSLAQSEAKRQKLDNVPLPTPSTVVPPPAAIAHNTWAPSNAPTTIRLVIQTINYPEKPEWNLNGQTIELTDLPLTMMISTVKERITSQIGMPYGKQKLSIQQTVMVNSKNLGFYGCTDGTVLTLGLKDRKK
ncbi:Pre-mRNA splicing factor PRP21 like protein-domain-containing protein [Halteromyces radiatus]|uniref:Pre-mRNA splicing factor PRP21 like protein-domain-containing protein n=1 Tax=Halteromyces radiatus TaxID=101107 RepID=UPI00221EE617|nr:Pre-mRNA splicing factor PRP21 like protein-domain-containing protein [Halteromyces radiatus]KAI8088908.1 Pre-mRNA splicing factor PRP21 like protein-domain-containing protein [Halteromyces radiatus]